MPEIFYELPPVSAAPSLAELPRSVRGAPIKVIGLAALVAGRLAYASAPDPEDWQRWLNKAVRHWLWHEAHRRRRRHFPSGYTDSGHPPIH
jgi:hypothetical protein